MSTTSLPPNAPMANGTFAAVNGEADVSSSSASAHIPPASHSLQDVCALVHAQVSSFLSAVPEDEVTRSTQEQARISMGVIEKALNEYEFSTLSLSYNGGKDCLVLLILYLAVIHTHFTQPSNRRKEFPKSIPSIYAKPPDPFPAVSDFVDYSARLYHLDLTHISTNPGPGKKRRSHSNPPITAPLAGLGPESVTPNQKTTNNSFQKPLDKPIISFRDAFALYLSSNPHIKAIFVGTRRTDPHGSHLTHFDPTDHNWPPFMRIHPVIDWRLSEIWCFLRSPHLQDIGRYLNGSATGDGRDSGTAGTAAPLRYCEMYDAGYTSLGGVNDTVKNPKLRYTDEQGKECYKPAYQMTADDGERLGRE
ncbi:uncharacterized protein Z520_01894 [Fonsecaea multimorphosa CBS 102226]|uniref:FAD synthase n=1 Tax=Fonsecaea multimorphosa CBS 102226 TaxID=1442371 RepID=A0A0D2HIL2_9EURO|nr:uncharacterized protein Z520_01894 [Fonsecaea multimorphosa CBS 102226]KIY01756.1 hypothetical protein Z520_01894 [Fonsecaea multimorphosa CBS 102226]OAL29950.1 hypothetical protein AYO22_01856 [Fonsecaea multimorphosa]